MLCFICNKKEGNICYNDRCEDCYIDGVLFFNMTIGTNFKAKEVKDKGRPYNQRIGMSKTTS